MSAPRTALMKVSPSAIWPVESHVCGRTVVLPEVDPEVRGTSGRLAASSHAAPKAHSVPAFERLHEAADAAPVHMVVSGEERAFERGTRLRS